jgi:phage/plasmid-like protein (TIGR03299 family)
MHNVETMFSAKETPWHKLGTVTPDVLTAKEAITTAGLDWTVSKRDLLTFDDEFNYSLKVPNYYSITRDTDNKVLGVVGNRYTPVQNHEAFAFLDNIVDSDDAKYETAGSLNDGTDVFILVNMESLFGNLTDSDEIMPYMLLSNNHTGRYSLKLTMTPIRVVCQNTLRMALSQRNVQQQVSLRHTSSIHGKEYNVRNVLQIAENYFTNFNHEVEMLIQQTVLDTQFDEIIYAMFPQPKAQDAKSNASLVRMENRREDIVDKIYDNYKNEKHTGSAWGVINAVNSYELWQKKTKAKVLKTQLDKQAMDFIRGKQSLTNKVKDLVSSGA